VTAPMRRGSTSWRYWRFLVLAIVRRSVFLLGLLALASCDDDPVSPFGLFAAKARWERANIDSYEMTVRVACECLLNDPVRVTVSEGIVVSRVNAVTGETVAANLESSIPDVVELFEILERATAEADDVHVEYDATYGFPTVLSIDWQENAVDDEVVYRVLDFAVGLE
jgi:hypothetical protein